MNTMLRLVCTMSLSKAVVAVCTLLFLDFIHSQLELIPERGGIYDFNKKHLNYLKFYVRRYSRKSIYYANLEFGLNYEANSNITLEIKFFEKLGNEYKNTFVEFKFKLCDLINKDEFFGPTLRATSLKCPVPKGEYLLQNLTLKKLSFPYKWPFEYGRGDCFAYQTGKTETVASGYLYFRIKQSHKKP